MTEPAAPQARADLLEPAGEAGTCIVKLSGELDVASAEQVRGCFIDAVSRNPSRLVVDLAELSFMDSTGLSLLLQAAAKLPLVQVVNASTLIRSLIETMGLSSVLRLPEP